MNHMRRSPAVPLALGGALVFFLFLAYATPYSPLDDMQWGMEEGLRWWLGGLLNGRYVGNFFAVILCRSFLVKTLLMGLGMFSLPLLMALVARWGKGFPLLPAYFFCCGGLLLMPPIIWKDVFGWVCGFGNYVVSILFFLCWVLLIPRAETAQTHKGLWAAGLFLMALSSGLFLENQTLLNLGLALLLVLRALLLRRGRLLALASLVGAAAAVVPMFLNQIFMDMLSTGSALNELRKFTFSLEDGLWAAGLTVVREYLAALLPLALSHGMYLTWPCSIITACALWRSSLRPLALLGVVPLACGWWCAAGEAPIPLWLASSLCWFLPGVALLLERTSWPEKLFSLALYLAAPLSLAPMAAINTRGGRIFLFPLVMLLVAAARAAGPLLARREITLLVAAGTVALMAMWGGRYGEVLSCNNLRSELIAQSIENHTSPLVLPTDRYSQVVWWFRNPWDVESADWFRRFYHIPDDITLIFLPPDTYESWPEISDEAWENRTELTPSKDFVPSLP